MNIILEQLISNSTFNVITAAIALASAVAAATPTPKSGTALAKIYKIVDFLALNVGRAKDRGK